MAWLQRVAFLLQRSSTALSLSRAGLGVNLVSPAANTPSFSASAGAAFARGASNCRSYAVSARLDDEDALLDAENDGPDFPARRRARATTPSSEAFAAVRTEVETTLEYKELPRKRLLLDLIESVSNKEQADEMFELLKKLKIERAVLRRQISPLNPHISIQVALACARVGDLEKGLVAVQHRNPFGLRPSLDAAHVLLTEAGEQNQVGLAVKIFRTLLMNGLNPKSTTADLLLRALSHEKQRNGAEFFRIAEEFFINGVKLWPGWYEKLMNRALIKGDMKLFEKWAHRRDAGGVPISKRIGFLMAKGYVIMGDAKKAADVLARGRAYVGPKEEESDDTFWDTHCRELVADWPVWAKERLPRGSVDVDKLKATLTELQAMLKEQGVRFEADVAADFMASKNPRGSANLGAGDSSEGIVEPEDGKITEPTADGGSTDGASEISEESARANESPGSMVDQERKED